MNVGLVKTTICFVVFRGLRSIIAVCAVWTVVLAAKAANAAISVQISEPASLSVQAGPLPISAIVTSTFQLQSVIAQVDTASSNLGFDGSKWTGTLSLADIPTGEKTLTVTATDFYGTSSSASLAFRYRHPPTVIVEEPSFFDIVGSTARVRARCVDEENSATCKLTVEGPFNPWPTALGQIDVTLNFTNPGWNHLQILAENDSGQRGGGQPIYIVSDPSLLGLRLIACAPGQILDFDATRLLFRPDLTDIAVADRRTGATTVIFPNQDFGFASDPTELFFRTTYLGSNNVLIAYYRFQGETTFRIWRAGTTFPEITVVSDIFAAGGDRAVHVAVNYTSRLVVTNLTDGTEVDLPNASVKPLVVRPSGAVLYSL